MNPKKINTNNQKKVEDCNFPEILSKVISKGIGLDSNPVDFFIGMAEELKLTMSKERLEQLQKLRDWCEEEIREIEDE